MFRNSNAWDVLWMNQLRVRKTLVESWRVEGGLQVLLGLWLMLGVCSLSVLESCIKLFVPVLMYSSESMIWREKKRSRIWAVQVDNLIGLLGIRRMDKVPNARIRQLFGVKKVLEEKIVLRWFAHVERVENDRIAKRVYVVECAGIRSVGRARKRCELIP